jgi:hypothetical protein
MSMGGGSMLCRHIWVCRTCGTHLSDWPESQKDEARLKWCYDTMNANLVKPLRTFDEWKEAIDDVLKKATD